MILILINCYQQLIEICHSKDEVYKIHGVFIDILKAFDKVWFKSLVFKLKCNEVSRNLLHILEEFLPNSKQELFLVVRHHFSLGPTLFLIYINDVAENLSSNPELFGDGTFLSFAVRKNLKHGLINGK